MSLTDSTEMRGTSTTVTGTATEEPERRIGCWGRCFRDWTQYIAAGSGIGFIVYSIYEFTVDSNLGGGVGAGGALVCAILFGRIRKLKPEKDLQERVKDLMQQVGSLNGIKDQLNLQLLEAKENVESLESLLTGKTNELESIVSKLQETEKSLSELQEVYDQFKDKTRSIAKTVASFNKENENLHVYIDGLNREIGEISDEGDSIEEGVAGVDRENAEMLDNIEDLDKLVERLQKELDFLQKQFMKMTSALGELKGMVSKLDEADDKFEKGTENLESAAPKLKQLVGALSDAIDKLKEDDEESSK